MLRSCPFCAEKIQRRAKICRFCSSKVEPIYVENAAANKQICVIVDLYQEGKSVEEIEKILKGRGEKTLDTSEQWSESRIQTIINSFCAVNQKIRIVRRPNKMSTLRMDRCAPNNGSAIAKTANELKLRW